MKKQSVASRKIKIDEQELHALIAAVVDERLRALQAGAPARADAAHNGQPGDPGEHGDYGIEWVAC